MRRDQHAVRRPRPEVLTAVLLAAISLSATGPATTRLAGGERVEWWRGQLPELVVLPRQGDGWSALSARYLKASSGLAELRAHNPRLEVPLRDVRVRVPWTVLRDEWKAAVVRALFPHDVAVPGGWQHQVGAPWGGEAETLWEIAELFCGDGARYRELRAANPELPMFPASGTSLLVPSTCLAFALAPAAPLPPPTPVAGTSATERTAPPPKPSVAPSPTPPTVRADGSAPLEYGAGEAVYRLQPGEALYSAVVVRFTGQLGAAEVNATAAELAKRSGITDVTSIPVGYPVRIPFELLLPEYLPPGHPRRVEWEKEREELAAIQRVIRAADLAGIHVILDAGHGGGDTGAVVEEVWEATYVYDVMARVKQALERSSKATVWTTVSDTGSPPRPQDQDRLPNRRTQRLLVDPPYDLADSSVGVHLRWVLSNAILARLQAEKVEPERVVFLSVHADSLHPAVRGLMVYVPARSLRPARLSPPPGLPDCRELRAARRASLSPTFRARSEALSGQLGQAIVKSAERFDLPVHRYEPVRSAIIRGRSRFVPAVLRYSQVPTAVLVEICNLNNAEDRSLLLTWKFREKLALAIAAGLAEAFSR
jgi:N-acetylmuramoyl-L-alanine amidase